MYVTHFLCVHNSLQFPSALRAQSLPYKIVKLIFRGEIGADHLFDFFRHTFHPVLAFVDHVVCRKEEKMSVINVERLMSLRQITALVFCMLKTAIN